jgi:hypothetical protein
MAGLTLPMLFGGGDGVLAPVTGSGAVEEKACGCRTGVFEAEVMVLG